MKRVRIAAIIPARMASSRFPGKPLLEVRGLPMVEHVRRRTCLCRGLSEVLVATCDPEIATMIEGYGGTCLMTSPAHPSASDRVAQAMQQLDCTHVINVQGDEILILPSDLERMVAAIEAEPDMSAWNAVAPIEEAAELNDPSIVKGVVSVSGRILFCSRHFPALAASLQDGTEPIRKILGVLGYRRDVLERYLTLARTPLEMAEAIDQSRLLEHDITVRGVTFPKGYVGINERHELEVVQDYLTRDPRQQLVLQEVLAG